MGRQTQRIDGDENSRQQERRRLCPIYHVNKAVRQSVLIELIKQAFLDFGDQITEILPLSLIEKYRLLDRKSAMFAMHFPKDPQESHQAKRRVILKSSFVPNADPRTEESEKAEKTAWRSIMMCNA